MGFFRNSNIDLKYAKVGFTAFCNLIHSGSNLKYYIPQIDMIADPESFTLTFASKVYNNIKYVFDYSGPEFIQFFREIEYNIAHTGSTSINAYLNFSKKDNKIFITVYVYTNASHNYSKSQNYINEMFEDISLPIIPSPNQKLYDLKSVIQKEIRALDKVYSRKKYDMNDSIKNIRKKLDELEVFYNKSK